MQTPARKDEGSAGDRKPNSRVSFSTLLRPALRSSPLTSNCTAVALKLAPLTRTLPSGRIGMAAPATDSTRSTRGVRNGTT
ncbi:hypothetical protein D3C84_994760 [compost metagenome]